MSEGCWVAFELVLAWRWLVAFDQLLHGGVHLPAALLNIADFIKQWGVSCGDLSRLMCRLLELMVAVLSIAALAESLILVVLAVWFGWLKGMSLMLTILAVRIEALEWTYSSRFAPFYVLKPGCVRDKSSSYHFDRRVFAAYTWYAWLEPFCVCNNFFATI